MYKIPSAEVWLNNCEKAKIERENFFENFPYGVAVTFMVFTHAPRVRLPVWELLFASILGGTDFFFAEGRVHNSL